jgi:hypothetical protein
MKNTPIDIPKLESKVNSMMKRRRKKSKFIEQGKVAHIHPYFRFRNVSLLLLVGKYDHGKQMTWLNNDYSQISYVQKERRFIPRLFITVVEEKTTRHILLLQRNRRLRLCKCIRLILSSSQMNISKPKGSPMRSTNS